MPVKPAFSPVARRTVAEQVRQRLADSIRDGSLVAGQPLPSERSLCEDFGVSRTSVREAIQGLVTVGLVERRGNRTHVVERLPGLGVADDGVVQLFELRRVVEVALVELAAQRASAADKAELVRLADAFTASLTVDEFLALDRRFHALVARLAGNPMLAEVELKVLEALASSADVDAVAATPAGAAARPSAATIARLMRNAGVAHRAIARAVSAGDAAAAAAATHGHLDEVADRLVPRHR